MQGDAKDSQKKKKKKCQTKLRIYRGQSQSVYHHGGLRKEAFSYLLQSHVELTTETSARTQELEESVVRL